MRTPFIISYWAKGLAVLACILAGHGLGQTLAKAAPMDAGFRYQGRLTDGGAPANGTFDLRFGLFSHVSDGAALAGPVTNQAVGVSDGLFVTTLDFGTNAFAGEKAWLEISVRRTSAGGEFTTLAPRQPLTPVPYALHALKAESLSAPLSPSLLPANVARLDASQVFTGPVTFGGNVNFAAGFTANLVTGDGAGLTNVTAVALSARLAQRFWRVSIPFVNVTNAGNPPDFTGKGSVPYNYRIGKYEVNNLQYIAMLNALAADDKYELYDTNMTFDLHGGILRSGNPGAYHYTIKPGMGHHPVVWVDFADAMRYCNWLHNGQPSGAQDATTTEDGAYTLSQEAILANTLVRNPTARFWIPSDDEWYKAAYHHPAELGGDPTGFWRFPVRSNEPPFAEEPPGWNNSANVCCGTDRMSTEVGAYVDASSFYGTFDQAGNVEEWTEEIIFITNRRLRGGSWTYNEFYSGSTDFEFDTPDYDADGIGFRIASVAEP